MEKWDNDLEKKYWKQRPKRNEKCFEYVEKVVDSVCESRQNECTLTIFRDVLNDAFSFLVATVYDKAISKSSNENGKEENHLSSKSIEFSYLSRFSFLIW